MLGLGWTEMLVIGVVALIFIGPKDLPMVMGRIGKVIGQVQRMGREFQREINRSTGLDEVRNLRTSITSPLKQTADEIRKEFNAIGKDGQQQPSGALKPTDPTQESVVDAIQEKAGMAPAKKSGTELAKDYGFKKNAAEPAKGSRTTPPSFADTDTAKAAKAKSDPVKAARRTSSAKTAATTPAKPAKPRAARASSTKSEAAKPATTKSTAAKAPASKPAAAKATRKPAAKAEAAPAPVADKTVAKPRAPRKKPADPAVKSE